jgi:hypothetical protein
MTKINTKPLLFTGAKFKQLVKLKLSFGGVGEQNFGGLYFVEDGKNFL